MTINERIRRAREHAGYSREEFRKALGLRSYETVRQWEEGVTSPRPKRYAAICELTGVREAWLATGQGHMLDNESNRPSASDVSRLARMLSLDEALTVAHEIIDRARKDET